MSEPKFTPGPWKGAIIDKYTETNSCYRITNDNYQLVFDIDNTCVEDADISLMLASPDMYEALTGVCAICEDRMQCEIEHGDEHCKFTKALRKAQGEK